MYNNQKLIFNSLRAAFECSSKNKLFNIFLNKNLYMVQMQQTQFYLAAPLQFTEYIKIERKTTKTNKLIVKF